MLERGQHVVHQVLTIFLYSDLQTTQGGARTQSDSLESALETV